MFKNHRVNASSLIDNLKDTTALTASRTMAGFVRGALSPFTFIPHSVITYLMYRHHYLDDAKAHAKESLKSTFYGVAPVIGYSIATLSIPSASEALEVSIMGGAFLRASKNFIQSVADVAPALIHNVKSMTGPK